MSPPLNRYEPNLYERTYDYKLDGVTVKELDQMKQANIEKIKEIEDRFLKFDSKSVNI